MKRIRTDWPDEVGSLSAQIGLAKQRGSLEHGVLDRLILMQRDRVAAVDRLIDRLHEARYWLLAGRVCEQSPTVTIKGGLLAAVQSGIMEGAGSAYRRLREWKLETPERPFLELTNAENAMVCYVMAAECDEDVQAERERE